MGPTPDAGAGCRRGARPVIGPLPRPTGFFSALPLALPLAVPLAIFTALAASATATPAAAVEPSLPRVEIIPAAPGPASPPWADEPPGTASPRSITWVDLSTGDWTAATDWRDLAIEVPGLFVRVGDGGLSTSYALRGHALTRTLLDGLPDVPVIPMALGNLWGSFFSRVEGGKAMTKPLRRGFWSRVSLTVDEPMKPAAVSPETLQARVASLLSTSP